MAIKTLDDLKAEENILLSMLAENRTMQQWLTDQNRRAFHVKYSASCRRGFSALETYFRGLLDVRLSKQK